MAAVSAHDRDQGRDRYVVGVDFGTLSARALVVRADDGSPAGTAIHEYAHQVMDAELAATGEPLPPDWALQDPEDYRAALGRSCPRRSRTPGSGGAGHRHRHRLHREHRASRAGRRNPALPARRAQRRQARLRQALEASRGAAAGGPDQRAGRRTRRAVAVPVRREDLLRMAVCQGPATAGRGTPDLPADRAVDRGGRLDHLATHRRGDQERLHGRLQGHPAGRPLPVRRIPGRAGPQVRHLRRWTSWSTRCRRSAAGQARSPRRRPS